MQKDATFFFSLFQNFAVPQKLAWIQISKVVYRLRKNKTKQKNILWTNEENIIKLKFHILFLRLILH